jgi:hypothetical protein
MKVKDYYNADCAKLLSQKIKTVFSNFNEKAFIKHIEKNILDKEFSEQMDVFVDAFELCLPDEPLILDNADYLYLGGRTHLAGTSDKPPNSCQYSQQPPPKVGA